MQTNKQINKKHPKKIWSTPRLIVHGPVEKITAQDGCDKDYGESDGFTFQGQAIWCGS